MKENKKKGQGHPVKLCFLSYFSHQQGGRMNKRVKGEECLSEPIFVQVKKEKVNNEIDKEPIKDIPCAWKTTTDFLIFRNPSCVFYPIRGSHHMTVLSMITHHHHHHHRQQRISHIHTVPPFRVSSCLLSLRPVYLTACNGTSVMQRTHWVEAVYWQANLANNVAWCTELATVIVFD